MILVVLTAVLAACGAAKLDRSYLPPPITAKTAGGSPGDLQAPIDGLPSGSYTNDAQGVVVDAVAPGTRTSGAEPTGLGGPRASYGSTDSKVGTAAFEGSLTGFGSPSPGGPNTRIAPGFGSIVGIDENIGGPAIRIAPGFSSIVASEGSDDDKTRASTLKFSNEIGSENYSYGFETDNGISIGENGIAADGIKANGEYSYKGDDGKVYSVSYTADEGGYKPHGSHLPTPPPIPDEILKSLEQNAKEEAAGVVDDGSYNAQKYNDEGDYPSNNGDGNNNSPSVNSGGATASGSFGSHSNQGNKPSLGTHGAGSYQPGLNVQGSNGLGNQFGSHDAANKHSSFGLNDQSKSQGLGASSPAGHESKFGQNQFGASPQFGARPTGLQGSNQGSGFQFGAQPGKHGSSATAVASSDGPGFVSPTGIPSFNAYPGLRLPGSSNKNTAYSSASTTGSGSASAFASTGPVGPGYRNPSASFGSTGSIDANSKFGSDSTGGASFPDLATVNPNDPSNASASASAQGLGASAEALSTSSPTFGNPNYNKVPTQSTFGFNSYSQNKQPNRLANNEYLPPVNAVGSTGQVSHGSNAYGAASSGSLPSSATASASTSGTPVFNQPTQHSNIFNTGALGQKTQTGSVPTRFGQQQSPGVLNKQNGQFFGIDNTQTQINSGSNGPLNSIGKPNKQTNLQGADATTAASSLGSQQSGFTSPTSVNSRPGQYTQTGNTFPTTFGLTQLPINNIRPSGVQNTQFTSGFPSVTTPIKVPETGLSTSSESNESATSGSGKLPSSKPTQPTLSQPSQPTFGSGLPSHSGQYKPQIGQVSFGQPGSNDASFASSSPKPSLNQQQGSDSSYYYNQPSKPFVTPISQYQTSQFGSNSAFGSPATGSSGPNFNKPNEPIASLTQQGSKFSNTPTVGSVTPTLSTHSAQTQASTGSSYYNGITQASISPFPSAAPTPASQFGSPSSQFGAQPVKQSGGSSSQTPFGATGSQQTFGQKPIVQSISQYGQQSSQTTNNKEQTSSQGTLYEYNKPTSTPETVTSTQTSIGPKSTKFGNQQSKPFQGSSHEGSFQYTTNQGSTFGSQPTNLFGPKPQLSQGVGSTFQTQSGQTQSGQKPFGTIQIGSNYQQTQFGAAGSQFGEKPSIQSGSIFQQPQFSSSGVQVGHKPFTSQKDGTQQNQGTIYEYNKPEVNLPSDKEEIVDVASGTSGSQTRQESSSTFGSEDKNTAVSGKPFGSSQAAIQQSQFTHGLKPQTNKINGFGSPQFGSTQTQFGSSFGSHFGQKPSTLTPQVMPISQYGSQSTQFGHGPQSVIGSSDIANKEESSETGKKPFTTQAGSTFHQSQSTFGSQPSSKLDQKPLSIQVTGFGGTQTTQSQFGSITGSQEGQTQEPTKDSSTGQTSQFKPFGSSQTGSTYQHTQTTQTSTFGSQPTIQFGQKPQMNEGTGLNQKPESAESAKPQIQPISQYGLKPGTQSTEGSFQKTEFGSTTGSQPSQKPQGTQGSIYTSSVASQGSISQFGTKPSSQFGSSFPSRFGQKPIQASSFTSNSQTSQFGQKPFINTQSAGIQKPQTTQFSQQTFASTPSTNKFGGSADSKFNTNTQTTQSTGSGTVSQTATSFGQKPFGSSSIFSQKPQTSFGFGTVSKGQSVQTTQFGTTQLKPTVFSQNTASSFSQTQFGNTFGSHFGQKPQTLSTTSQTGASLGQKPTSVSQTGSYQPSQFGSSVGFQFQKPLTSSVFKGQPVQTTQFNVKPFGSSQSSFTQTQFGSNTASNFGQKPESGSGLTSSNIPAVKPISQYGLKPFGSQFSGGLTQTQFGINSQSQSGQTTQSSQQPSNSLTGSSFTQTQYGGQKSQASSGAATAQVEPISQYGKKPFGSVQQSQYDSFTGSQSTQNKGNQGQPLQTQTQFEQKPFGGSQLIDSTFQQTQSSSQFGQKPALGTQTSSSAFSQSSQSQFGTQAKKPFDNTQIPFQTQFGSTTVQKPQSSATAFASSPGSLGTQFGQGFKEQTSTFGSVGTPLPQKPFGSSLTQTGQYTQTSQLGTQSYKPFGNRGSVFQIDQKTQPTSTSVSAQSSSQSVGSGSSEGYNYQKPQTAATQFGEQTKPGNQKLPTQTSITGQQSSSQFNNQYQAPVSSSQFEVQPTKPNDHNIFGSQTSRPQFNGQPFNSVSTVATPVKNTAQFGVQPTKPTVQSTGQSFKPVAATQISIDQLQASLPSSQPPKFGVQPTQGTIVSTRQPSQTSGAYNQPIKPNVFGSVTSTSFPSINLGAQDSVNQGSSVSTVQTPISNVEPNKQPSHSFVGKGEEFGGPRDPPKFDDKTGYHY